MTRLEPITVISYLGRTWEAPSTQQETRCTVEKREVATKRPSIPSVQWPKLGTSTLEDIHILECSRAQILALQDLAQDHPNNLGRSNQVSAWSSYAMELTLATLSLCLKRSGRLASTSSHTALRLTCLFSSQAWSLYLDFLSFQRRPWSLSQSAYLSLLLTRRKES